MSEERSYTVALVDDDAQLRRLLARSLRGAGYEVVSCSSLEEGVAAVRSGVDILIIDVKLGEDSGVDVVRAARDAGVALPAIVAISGEAAPTETFELARLGTRGFLQKPFGTNELQQEIERVVNEPPEIDPAIRGHVGQTQLRDVIRLVRKSMLEQALAKAGGNRGGAAELLRVTRQAVQYMIHDQDLLGD